MLKEISHFKCEKQMKRKEIREQGSNKQNQTLHTFYDGTQSTKNKRFVFEQQPIAIEISTKSLL
jgi:hypothetical protein